MATEWLSSYKELNNSFQKKLVFRLGVDSGFFAEYTNMVLAIAYCLKNQIQFQLSTRHAVFAMKEGWNDFFLPFVEEDNNHYNLLYNTRTYKLTQNFKKLSEVKPWILKERVLRFSKKNIAKFIKHRNNIDFFTQDLWPKHRNKQFAKEIFNIPFLGFHNAKLLDVTEKIISEIWLYNENVERIINQHKASIKLPEEYISIQIRSGDKFIEVKLRAIHEYIEVAKKYSSEKTAFILTDDYTNIELLQEYYPDWLIFTLCTPEERGYFHEEFKKQDSAFKFQQHLKLFASVDICCNAKKFIGTYTSAPGMFIGMRRGEAFCICLDHSEWGIF